MPIKNRQFVLAARPQGMPKESDFKLVEREIRNPGSGEVLLRTLYLSVDPYMRGRISGVKTYADPVEIGAVMVGATIGEVVESKNPGFQAGDIAAGYWGWSEHGISNGRDLRKLDVSLAPVTTALGVLGATGLTAYFGLVDICKPQSGETVLVSGAAGAVGSIVGQIAKIKGCRAIGTAGSDAKVRHVVNDLGFDAALNYKTRSDYTGALHELCPKGIDCYFDNVGGAITDAVFPALNLHARLAICGQISQYNATKPELGPRPFGWFIVKRCRVEGFLILDYQHRFGEGIAELARWLREGKLKHREDIVEGFENTPRAFIGMLEGDNVGKRIVKVE